MAKKIPTLLRRMKIKLFWVYFLFLVGFLVVIGRLFYFSMEKGKDYEKRVLSQQKYSSVTIPYKRGDIVDRKGTVLAKSERVYNLILEPVNILKDKKQREATVSALVKYLGYEQSELDQLIDSNSKSYYVIVEKELEYDKVKPYKEYLETKEGKKVTGVWFEEDYKRKYPYSTLACHLIGFTSSGNVGNWGIEQYYSNTLNGVNGRQYGFLNEELELERTVKPAINGNTIVSTIDANVQTIVEKHIAKFQKETGSDNTSVLVMDPNSGEVITMANSNPFDLNNPKDDTLLSTYLGKEEVEKMNDEEKLNAYSELWRNYIISNTYEPGSTFKPFTVAAGLEEGILKGNETYVCDGKQYFKGVEKPVKCNKVTGHGTITLEQSIMLSCNDALMQIGEKEGVEVFSKYQHIFNFGEKTGIDLPGEADAKGLLIQADKFRPIDLGINSFGQGFNCSMIQLASGFCSLINGGDYYEPHVVKQVLNDEGGLVKNVEKKVLKKTVSKSTSDTLKQYLYKTVAEGTAKSAGVEGYAIGGKTGTAQKYPRAEKNYLVSFIGFAPVDKPQFLIYVTIDVPHTSPQANSGLATHLAHDIMEEILPYYNINKTEDTSQKETE
ncbi:MAG: penicillin-binding transpeptidase domain-containing protein [Lachnospiraceae bacterium]|nr:penicillin-binding transpeptidase domain-containing protein [Lachnospiraceae bacterium]